jgi:3-oxoadipate enol-lactonase
MDTGDGGAPQPRLPNRTVWALAVGCGITVANLYYSQPLLATMAEDFGVPEDRLGMVSALTQPAGLLDQLHLPAAVIIGHSMGTLVVQGFAARFPEKTRALVLAGALTDLPEAAKEVYRQRAALVEREGMISVADLILDGALTPGTRAGNLPLAGLARDMLLSNNPASYAGHCRALVAGSARADQPHIACPTLLLVGDQDTVAPLAVQRQTTTAIAGSRLAIVPRTAHLTMLEMPEPFNAYLLEFLAGL